MHCTSICWFLEAILILVPEITFPAFSDEGFPDLCYVHVRSNGKPAVFKLPLSKHIELLLFLISYYKINFTATRLAARSGIENELRTNFTLTRDGPINLKILSFVWVFGNLKLENVNGNLVYEVPIKDLGKPEHVERTFPAGSYHLILKNISRANIFRIEIKQKYYGCFKNRPTFNIYLLALLSITSRR
jgi:hypothetical protein